MEYGSSIEFYSIDSMMVIVFPLSSGDKINDCINNIKKYTILLYNYYQFRKYSSYYKSFNCILIYFTKTLGKNSFHSKNSY